MTPERRAKELVNKHVLTSVKNTPLTGINYRLLAKEQALITVLEIIGALYEANPYGSDEENKVAYWISVQKEIEKL